MRKSLEWLNRKINFVFQYLVLLIATNFWISFMLVEEVYKMKNIVFHALVLMLGLAAAVYAICFICKWTGKSMKVSEEMKQKMRDILNDHEIRIQKLEDRIRSVLFVNIILCIVVSVLLVAFIATTVAPEAVRWYNGLSNYNRGAIDGIVAALMLTIFVITLSRLKSMW
jgi:hypothetical protein